MAKFYRVKKDTFLWEEGAILEEKGSGYVAIDELFNKENTGSEYISSNIIESEGDWFERVYPVNLISKTVYKLKDEAKEHLKKGFKEE